MRYSSGNGFGHGGYRREVEVQFGPPMSPVVLGLLIANGLTYLLLTLDRTGHWGFIDLWLSLIPAAVTHLFQVWRLFTYQFLHSPHLSHIFFNMFTLWMFGPDVERVMGGGRFLRYFLLCGVGAGVCSVLVSWNSIVPVMGASGAIYALMLAYATFFPDRELLLFFVLPVRARYLVWGMVFLELFLSVSVSQDGIAHSAHLGGLLVGWLLLRRRLRPPSPKGLWLELRAWWWRRRFRVYRNETPPRTH